MPYFHSLIKKEATPLLNKAITAGGFTMHIKVVFQLCPTHYPGEEPKEQWVQDWNSSVVLTAFQTHGNKHYLPDCPQSNPAKQTADGKCGSGGDRERRGDRLC